MRRLLMIARREYLSYLKTPGFWISLCVAPLVIGFATLGGTRAVQSTAPPPRLAVVDLSHSGFDQALEPALEGPDPLARIAPAPPRAADARSPEQASQAMREAMAGPRPSLDAGVVVSGAPAQLRLDVWSRDIGDPGLAGTIQAVAAARMRQARLGAQGVSPEVLRQLDQAAPEVRRFSPKSSGPMSFKDQAPGLAAMASAFVLWMSVVTGAGILLNSVIEEKSGRILEVLMSSASIPEILGGKILGVAALSATVLAVWGALGLGVMLKGSPGQLGQVLGALSAHGLIVYFALFFIGGYLMYASVFAAIGAFCETTREAQTLLGPLMILLSVPILFLTTAVQRPDAPVVAALSFVPPFTPFLMTARIASGLPAWQAIAGLLEMGVTASVVVWLCGRAFQAGALSGGGLDLKRLVGSALRRR